MLDRGPVPQQCSEVAPITRLTFVFTHAYGGSGSFVEKRPNKSTNQELEDILVYANRVPLSIWRKLSLGARVEYGTLKLQPR